MDSKTEETLRSFNLSPRCEEEERKNWQAWLARQEEAARRDWEARLTRLEEEARRDWETRLARLEEEARRNLAASPVRLEDGEEAKSSSLADPSSTSTDSPTTTGLPTPTDLSSTADLSTTTDSSTDTDTSTVTPAPEPTMSQSDITITASPATETPSEVDVDAGSEPEPKSDPKPSRLRPAPHKKPQSSHPKPKDHDDLQKGPWSLPVKKGPKHPKKAGMTVLWDAPLEYDCDNEKPKKCDFVPAPKVIDVELEGLVYWVQPNGKEVTLPGRLAWTVPDLSLDDAEKTDAEKTKGKKPLKPWEEEGKGNTFVKRDPMPTATTMSTVTMTATRATLEPWMDTPGLHHKPDHHSAYLQNNLVPVVLAVFCLLLFGGFIIFLAIQRWRSRKNEKKASARKRGGNRNGAVDGGDDYGEV